MSNNTEKNNSKVLSKKIVFKSKFFQVNHVVVERDGKKFEKDFVYRNPVVFILPLTENNEIYLLSQYRDAYEKRLLEVVAGTIENVEDDPLAVAKKELSEETGLTAQKWTYLRTLNLSVNMNADIHVFLAEDLQIGEAHADDDEDIIVIKMPLEEAVNKVISGEINTGSHMGVLLLLDALRKEGKL